MMPQDPSVAPKPSLEANDMEGWFTFLVERLGRHWPWLGRGHAAIELGVEANVQTMKPERVQ